MLRNSSRRVVFNHQNFGDETWAKRGPCMGHRWATDKNCIDCEQFVAADVMVLKGKSEIAQRDGMPRNSRIYGAKPFTSVVTKGPFR